MKVKEIKSYSRGRYKVCLEGEADFILYAKELNKYDISEEKDLSEEDYREIMEEILIPRAKKRAMHLLEKMDRTEDNLEKKLSEGGYPKEAIDEAVSYVKSFNYVNDERYAQNYIRSYQGKRSKERIRTDLIQKGIDKEKIDAAMEETYVTDERTMIEELLRKRGFDPENADRKDREKNYRFLVSKGFKTDDILSVMKQCVTEL